MIKGSYNKLKGILGLSLSLAKAQFKLRNEGSYLGIFWYLLDPLFMFLILLFLRNVLTNKSVEYYPAYLFLGLIMFNLFRHGTISSTKVISSNSGFIKTMNVNKESFVISGLLQAIFSHLFEIIILISLMIYLNISLFGLLFYPFIFGLLVIFILGFSFILSTLGVYINDLANVWSVFVNLLWFSTPIYYVATKGNIHFLNKINPLFYFIDSARDSLIYGTFSSFDNWIIMITISLVFLLIGLIIFYKNKNKFAELA